MSEHQITAAEKAYNDHLNSAIRLREYCASFFKSLSDHPECIEMARKLKKKMSAKTMRQKLLFASPERITLKLSSDCFELIGLDWYLRVSFETLNSPDPIEAFRKSLEERISNELIEEARNAYAKYQQLHRRFERPRGIDKLIAAPSPATQP